MKKSAKREKKPATPNPGGKNCVKDFLIFFGENPFPERIFWFFEKILSGKGFSGFLRNSFPGKDFLIF